MADMADIGQVESLLERIGQQCWSTKKIVPVTYMNSTAALNRLPASLAVGLHQFQRGAR